MEEKTDPLWLRILSSGFEGLIVWGIVLVMMPILAVGLAVDFLLGRMKK